METRKNWLILKLEKLTHRGIRYVWSGLELMVVFKEIQKEKHVSKHDTRRIKSI